uniref:nickel insertion protein n=1 Tax=Halorubrum sp. Boch-26 TaxID=2994426 RepID=UPI002469A56F
MRTIVFDGRTGAAGDMVCAALIAAGADPEALSPVTDRLPVRYEVGEATKNGIRATTVDVLLDGDDDESGATGNDGEHDHGDGHDHSHDHSHSHNHDHNTKQQLPQPPILLNNNTHIFCFFYK